ncbi:MAG: alkaline phosphatase D family protein [Pseudobacteriovorax sp.]|nr:alkaline phosphatase D family protein [Pseudobacteriovorax sp.]
MKRRDMVKLFSLGLLTPWNSMGSGESVDSLADSVAQDTFPCGISSGDPSDSGVILWTKLSASCIKPGQSLFFIVADDSGLNQVVLRGKVGSDAIRAENDYTIRIDLDGQLDANRFYYYRFYYGQDASRLGRCRTLPAEDQDLSQLSFAIANCQDYTNGYYNAYDHIAKDAVDYILHLGDFIYESLLVHKEGHYPDRRIELPSGKHIAQDIEDYRHLYQIYKSDGFLQKALAKHTIIHIWDDHESVNNAYWDYDSDTMAAPGNHSDKSSDEMRQLKLDSQQAWYEYLPVRAEYFADEEHPHDRLEIYRSFSFGKLAHLMLTDGRTYRSRPSCDESKTYLSSKYCDKSEPAFYGSMLGREQKDWLLSELTGTGSIWKLWGNQTLFSQASIKIANRQVTTLNTDSWDGYSEERDEIMATIKDHNIENFTVLTGDFHATIVSDIIPENSVDKKPVGLELLTPALSSTNMYNSLVNKAGSLKFLSGLVTGLVVKLMKRGNRGMRFLNPFDQGYALLTVTEDSLSYTAYKVSKEKRKSDSKRDVITHVVQKRSGL